MSKLATMMTRKSTLSGRATDLKHALQSSSKPTIYVHGNYFAINHCDLTTILVKELATIEAELKEIKDKIEMIDKLIS